MVEAQKRGFEIVIGNELEQSCAAIAEKRGFEIYKGFFENFELKNSALFDFIFADNVIEHAMNPILFLEKAYSILEENGLLVLRLPDTQDFGPTLKLIDHTYHFTRKSITAFVEKVGFKVEKIFYSGTFQGSKYAIDPKQRIENMTVVARKSSK
jgi:2-polyprenyl-3-methyl-5-hydroxy-6-metoxy-1,4-benzoquinol methylase